MTDMPIEEVKRIARNSSIYERMQIRRAFETAIEAVERERDSLRAQVASIRAETVEEIATAPKDGTEIMLFAKRWYIGRWAHNDYVTAIRGPMTAWFTDYNRDHFLLEVTHWCPLPLKPSLSGSAQRG